MGNAIQAVVKDYVVFEDYPPQQQSKICKKFKRATTDSGREVRFDEERAGIYNLLVIYELFTGLDRAEIEAKFEGKGYGDFKKEVAEVVIEGVRPIQERYQELTADPAQLDAILAKGADKARSVANEALTRAKEATGLL